MTNDTDVVFVVETTHGFTESFDAHTIDTLLRLGLIELAESRHVITNRAGHGVGPLHHFYRPVSR